MRLCQALPTGSPSSKDQYVSASVFHSCCPLGRAKSTVLVSLTVWLPYPSISAVLGVTAHNPAYRIITQRLYYKEEESRNSWYCCGGSHDQAVAIQPRITALG
ncbi:uncharacterized protein [Miscanthus floridulus]|uniref:uncharacterized protein n=1 Tax=Miscanthus floridulus TaxID=154761 RepID=UPI003457F1E3